MKNLLYLFSVVFGLILISCSKEDSPIIPSYEGVVVNSLTNQPFEGITVSVTNGNNTKLSTTTNNQGEFKFSLNTEGLSGEYYIQIGNSNTEKKQIQITGIGKIENNLGIIKIEPDTKPQCKITKVELTDGTITMTGEIESSGFSNITAVGFYISKFDKVTNESVSIRAALDDEGFVATYEENKLDIATEYYFIPFAINGCGEGLGAPHKFVSSECTPIVDWQSYNSITSSSATAGTAVTMYAEISSDGGSEIIESGFCWDIEGQPTIESSKKYLTGASKYYNIEVTGLKAETKYFARPYVKNKRGGIGYGTIKSFETQSGTPIVVTEKLSATPSKIDMWGEVRSDRGFAIKRCGFCYSTNPNPTINDKVIEYPHPQVGSYSVSTSNILDGTLYYVRAFAENDCGLTYGDLLDTTTPVIAQFIVKDSKGNGIPNATIIIGNSTFSCDNLGEKEIQATPGTYQYTVSATGYKTSAQQTINISRTNKLFEIVLQIEPEYIELTSYGIAVQTKDIGWSDYESIILMCKSSTVGGYNDWRLPTKEELMVLYNNKELIGNFSDKSTRRSYWSSDTDNGWPYYINFYDGSINTTYPSNTLSGRCVRSIK